MSATTGAAAPPRRRIWSEFVPYARLRSRGVIKLLHSRGLQILVAVTPSTIGGLGELARAFDGAGVDFGVWPMVRDDDGRWGSTFNAQVYSDFVLRAAEVVRPTAVAIDLEPPIDLLRRMLKADPRALRTLSHPDPTGTGRASLRALLERIADRGCSSLGAVSPLVLSDRPGQAAWQWLLGTPTEDMPFDALSFMAYTSLFEGYSRGLIPRGVATSLLAQTAHEARQQWGSKASLSLGTVGGGAVGDERPYRSVAELSEDVAAARACGIEDLALFDLSGVLTRPQPEAWLDAFVHTPAAACPPDQRRRAVLVAKAMGRTSSAISWYRMRRIRH